MYVILLPWRVWGKCMARWHDFDENLGSMWRMQSNSIATLKHQLQILCKRTTHPPQIFFVQMDGVHAQDMFSTQSSRQTEPRTHDKCPVLTENDLSMCRIGPDRVRTIANQLRMSCNCTETCQIISDSPWAWRMFWTSPKYSSWHEESWRITRHYWESPRICTASERHCYDLGRTWGELEMPPIRNGVVSVLH